MSRSRAELGLWLESLGFAPEVRFRGLSGTRQFRWDWAHERMGIAVEYNGIMGRDPSHSSIAGILRDDEKTTEGQLCGFTVIRCNAKTVGDGRCQAWIEFAIAKSA